MTEAASPTILQVPLTAEQLSDLDEFQRIESLPTREAALQLVLDIGLASVTRKGRRLWDKPVDKFD